MYEHKNAANAEEQKEEFLDENKLDEKSRGEAEIHIYREI